MSKPLKRKLKSLLFDGETLRLMSLTFLMKPIGLVSQILMAKYYGAGVHYDAYILAFFLVSFSSQLVGRVFTAVAVPHLTEIRLRLADRDQAAYNNALVLLSLVPVVLLSAVLILRGIWVVDLAAPSAPEETRQLAVRMLRFMALPGILAAIVQSFKAVLNANRVYRVPALMPIINAAVMLIVLIATHRPLGIWALPTAFAVSFSVQAALIVGYSSILKVVRAVRPRAERSDLRELWRRTWMVLIDSVLLIINSFVDKAFASSLIAGSISAIAYANTLMNLGMQLFQFSLVTIMFTRMSEDLSRGDIAACSRYLDSNLRRLARLTVPVCLAIAVASHEIVLILFQRDAFSAEDTARTASVLAMFILGLPAVLINLVVARVFHSLKQLRDKMWLALQYLLTNLAGNYLLIGPLQVAGLALSSTIAINLHLALSVFVLSRYRTGLDIAGISRRVLVHYVLGTITWLIYQFGGLDAVLDGWRDASGGWNALLVGASRGLTILLIYAILLTIRRRLMSRREETAHPGAEADT